MKNLFYKRLIISSLLCVISSIGMFPRSLEPNKLLKDTTVSVIDTIRAREVYNSIEPEVQNMLNELNNKYLVCDELIKSNKKKVKSDIELQILQEAYNYALSDNPKLKNYKTNNPRNWPIIIPLAGPFIKAIIDKGRDGTKTTEVYDKNVKKGKLTNDVRKYLSIFANHLRNQIESMENSMKNNWLSFVDNPPRKIVTIQIKNPYYRGYHYDDEYMLDKIDKSAMTEGVEFLFSKGGKYKKESYPIKISYLQFPEIPNFRVTYDENRADKIYEVYDNKGNLVFVPYLDRNAYDIFNEFKRIVYFNDYKNNKYNIKSKNQKTQKFLNLWLGRKNGFKVSQNELAAIQGAISLSEMFGSPLTANAIALKGMNEVLDYRDETGDNFVNQLEQDHSNDFGYIYSIERMGDKQFRVIYINDETLKPSICGIVTFENGDEPYTSNFSVRLCEMPADVPPVIRNTYKYTY